MKLASRTNKLWLTTALLSVGTVMAATSALAAPPVNDIYLGGNLAFSRTPNLGGNINGALSNQGFTSSTSTDTPKVTGGLRLGYRINPNLAVEASYDNISSKNVQSNISGPTADTASGEWKTNGFGLHIVGIEPIDSKWSVFGRVGIEQFHTKLDLASNSGGTTGVSTSGNNTSLALGAGAAYALTSNVDATAELVHYNRVGESGSTGTSAVNQFNFGVRYHFY